MTGGFGSFGSFGRGRLAHNPAASALARRRLKRSSIYLSWQRAALSAVARAKSAKSAKSAKRSAA